MTVSVVVLSYNRPHFLNESLAAIAAQTHQPVEVLVVDNRSPRSDEVAAVVAGFSGVRLIANHDNRGFAGGMNVGIRAAAGEYVYLTEDDVVLAPNYLERVLGYAKNHPHVGLVGGMLLNRGDGTIRAAGGEFNLGGIFRHRLLAEGEADRGQLVEPYRVSFVSGSTVLARREYLQSIGGFREDFYLYVEDLELCARVLRSGREIVVVPTAKAHHFDPPSGHVESPVVKFHKLKNLGALYLLHAPGRVLPEFIARYGAWAAVKSALANRSELGPLLRAWGWVLAHLPTLLRDRRNGRKTPHSAVDQQTAVA